ncbi:flippase-like domain-containing protein [bacterium]|nr:flippase-like domain-containing protein [bacterium]
MKKHLITVVKLAVTFTILYLIFKKFQIGLDDILNSFKHQPGWFGMAFLMQVGAILFSIMRWNVLLKGQNLVVPFPHIVKTFLVGRFLGTFTPTGVGLEAYKAYDIARYTGQTEASVSVVLIEKMIGTFFSLSLWVLVTLPFFVGAIDVKFLYVFGMFFGILLILALILLFSPNFFRVFLRMNFPLKGKIEKPLNRMVDAFTIYSKKKGALLSAVLLGLVVYLFWFLTYYMNSLAMGAGLALGDIIKVGPLTQIATMIPLSIAGIGLREGAFMGLLDTLGVFAGTTSAARSAMMLSATMVYFVSVSVNVFGAIIFLTRRTDYKKQIEEMKQSS